MAATTKGIHGFGGGSGIRSPRYRRDDLKEVKVKISHSVHTKLHMLKLLRGKSIADTIEEALEAHFESLKIKDPKAFEVDQRDS